MSVLEFDGVGGYLEPEQEAGYEWDVRLSYTVEVSLSVLAGHERQDAVDVGDMRVSFADIDGVRDWDLVHSKAEAKDTVYADDTRAEEILGWCDGPTVPSSDTFWDDTEHFDAETVSEYATESDGDV